MRLIDADEAKKQVRQLQVLKPSEKNLLTLALDRAPTYEPPNDPLTLEQLREMDGEPVWIERYDDGRPIGYAIVGDFMSLYGVYFGTKRGGLRLPYDEYGKTWLAYRRKPENV